MSSSVLMPGRRHRVRPAGGPVAFREYVDMRARAEGAARARVRAGTVVRADEVTAPLPSGLCRRGVHTALGDCSPGSSPRCPEVLIGGRGR
ncbi:hypothetical protein [Streptomyces sp. NPDC090994]|uniref:hypothetical protein n=1 Tax=Streptomyces sp. NPDC090994 TaxID=3365969 RepID=UPI003823A2F8